MLGPDLRRSQCSWTVPGCLLSMCTVAGVLPERVRRGGLGLRMLITLDRGSRPVPGGRKPVECGPVRLLAGPILLGAGPPPFCASTQWLGHDTGATINESIAGRVAIHLVSIPVLLGIIRSARQQHIHMIQNDGPHIARVPSPLGTTNMRLARDMRTRSECDRLQPHAYGHGALSCRECAVMAHVCRPPVRTVSRDGGGVCCQKATTSV